MPKYPDVITSEQTIKAAEGNEIRLYLHKPKNQNGEVSCVVHAHGGGMVILTAADPMFVRWRKTLASLGYGRCWSWIPQRGGSWEIILSQLD